MNFKKVLNPRISKSATALSTRYYSMQSKRKMAYVFVGRPFRQNKLSELFEIDQQFPFPGRVASNFLQNPKGFFPGQDGAKFIQISKTKVNSRGQEEIEEIRIQPISSEFEEMGSQSIGGEFVDAELTKFIRDKLVVHETEKLFGSNVSKVSMAELTNDGRDVKPNDEYSPPANFVSDKDLISEVINLHADAKIWSNISMELVHLRSTLMTQEVEKVFGIRLNEITMIHIVCGRNQRDREVTGTNSTKDDGREEGTKEHEEGNKLDHAFVFVKIADKICSELTRSSSYWADFIDPRNGKAYRRTKNRVKNDPSFGESCLALEQDKNYKYMGMEHAQRGECLMIKDVQWDDSRIIGAIYTNAPSQVVTELFHRMNDQTIGGDNGGKEKTH